MIETRFIVRISPTMANEYAVRDVFDFIGTAGLYRLNKAEILLLLEDCTHLLSEEMRPDRNRSELTAYGALNKQLLSIYNSKRFKEACVS